MTSRTLITSSRPIVYALAASMLTLHGCSCHDEGDYFWKFEEPPMEASIDVGLPPEDAGEPDEGFVPIDVGGEPEDPEDWDWAFPDPEIEPDPPEWEETEWRSEVVAEGLPRSFALNDRTSVVVDRQGTVWLGYHRCADRFCADPELVVARRPVGGSWSYETIDRHEGLFGLSVIHANEPLAVYVDAPDQSLALAQRRAEGGWLIDRLAEGRVSAADGFDITHDRARFYLSYAQEGEDRVEFYSYNTASPTPLWRRLRDLSPATSAAFDEGLKAGNALDFYLIHRGMGANFQISRYDVGQDAWTTSQRDYTTQVSALVYRQNGQLCVSGSGDRGLVIDCGDFEDPLSQRQFFNNGQTYYLSSMVEARDQTLFVAYHLADEQDLRIARSNEDRWQWRSERVFQGPTFGVSTAIDHRDHVLVSYYYCPGDTCDVRLMERVP